MTTPKTISSHNIIGYQEPAMQKIAGINEAPLDYKILKNKGGGTTSAIFDFWGTGGAVGDGTYREVNIGGAEGDMQVAYTAYTLLTGLGTIDYKLTRKSTGVTIIGNNITVPAGKACRISMNFTAGTMLGRVTVTGGSLRYLLGGSLDFSNTTPTCAFINASASDATFVIKYATSAANRPIFGVLIEIF